MARSVYIRLLFGGILMLNKIKCFFGFHCYHTFTITMSDSRTLQFKECYRCKVVKAKRI